MLTQDNSEHNNAQRRKMTHSDAQQRTATGRRKRNTTTQVSGRKEKKHRKAQVFKNCLCNCLNRNRLQVRVQPSEPQATARNWLR